MDKEELINDILPSLEKVIKFSLVNDLNIHTPVGGKFAELLVAADLWKHEPKLGRHRGNVKTVQRPRSCDVVLAKTKKKLEVKWAMCHYRQDDPFVGRCGALPFWGWGFSGGKQFTGKKFDYCILIAAEKDGAYPESIFVVKSEEMTEESMGGLRGSSVYAAGSFYIEFSRNENFYCKRSWHKGPSPLEKDIFQNQAKFESRWEELKSKGCLE